MAEILSVGACQLWHATLLCFSYISLMWIRQFYLIYSPLCAFIFCISQMVIKCKSRCNTFLKISKNFKALKAVGAAMLQPEAWQAATNLLISSARPCAVSECTDTLSSAFSAGGRQWLSACHFQEARRSLLFCRVFAALTMPGCKQQSETCAGIIRIWEA